MPINDQLGAPSSTVIVSGRNTLHRVFIHNAAVSDDVAPINLSAIKSVEHDAPTPERSEKYYQEGGGDEPLEYEVGQSHNVRITVYAGQLTSLLSTLMSVTGFGTTGYYAQPLRFGSLARFDIESVFRAKDNVTPKFSEVHTDLILKPFPVNSPMEDVDVVLNAISYHDPFIMAPGAEMAYSQFSGDGSTVSFSLPDTPIPLVDITEDYADDWVADNLVYLKVKASGASVGTRQKSGFQVSGSDVVFTTAPAAGSIVQVFFARATA